MNNHCLIDISALPFGTFGNDPEVHHLRVLDANVAVAAPDEHDGVQAHPGQEVRSSQEQVTLAQTERGVLNLK